jgi:hypothetical protein
MKIHSLYSYFTWIFTLQFICRISQYSDWLHLAYRMANGIARGELHWLVSSSQTPSQKQGSSAVPSGNVRSVNIITNLQQQWMGCCGQYWPLTTLKPKEYREDIHPNHEKMWSVASSGMLRRVALVRTVVSEELSASFIRVIRIGELGTTTWYL